MKRTRYAPLAWFVLGFGIFMFTRMSKIVPTIPVAMLIAPVFILRFTRTQPARRGILLTLVGFLLSINIGLWGLFDLDGGTSILVYSIVRSSLLAVLYFLPYLIDRLVYPKFAERGPASSLIFPIITTALFFLSSLEGPFDGAIQSGKFVYGPVVFQQLLSLFGIWSFIFLTSWFASLLNYAWENSFKWSKIRWESAIFLSMVTLILVFGAIKISSSRPEPSTVKIAAVVLVPEEGDAVSLDQAWAEKLVSPFEQSVARIAALTKTAALNGAKIVSFQEFAMLIHEKDEQGLREEYQRIARENNVYLSITYAYYAQEGKGENKHLLIDNSGQIQLDYTKRYVSGLAELDLGEAGVYRKGPEILQSVETPYGRIAVSICRDMEFPHYMRQAGRDDVDIMLSPAYEWPKGLVVHSVYMRGIEYGFSLVRPTYNGITIAQDFNGRILSQMDSDATGDGILYADVPTRGVNTLYTEVGDLLAWSSVLGFLGLVLLGVVLSIRQKKRERADPGMSVPIRPKERGHVPARQAIRNIIIFTILVNGLAWLGPVLGGDPTAPGLGFLVWAIAPTASALAVKLLLRDEVSLGFKPAFRGNGRWYALSISAYPVAMAVVLVLGTLLGVSTLSDLTVSSFVTAMIPLAVTFFIFAILEEVGWRGYLAPKLYGLNDSLLGHVLVGVIWASWHLPYLRELWAHTSEGLVTLLPRFFLGTIVFAVVYGEIRIRTGSIWPAVLMHWMGNAVANTLLTGFAGGGFVSLVPGKEWLGSFGGAGVLMIAFFGLLGSALYLRRRGQSETQPAMPVGETSAHG